MIKSMGRGIARGEGHGGRVSIMLAGYGGGEGMSLVVEKIHRTLLHYVNRT